MDAMAPRTERRPCSLVGLAVAVLVVTALAGALSPLAAQTPPATPVVAPQTDQQYQQADPELFGVAKQYFPGDGVGVPPKRIFRLTRDQLDASAASLLPGYAAPSVKAFMPKDPLQTNYEYAEILNFNPANVGGLAGWATVSVR